MIKEELLHIVEAEDIRFICLQFCDIFGQQKNVTVSASQIHRVLKNQITIDGSSIEGFVRIHESDQFLYPDLSSFCVLPWMQGAGKVARLICDVYNPDGTPFVGDPRNVLRRVLNKAASLGYCVNVGPECEFFLFETDERGKPTTRTNDEAGYFDLATLDHGELTRRQVCLVLEEMGFQIEASHHECAAGQHEIDFKYGEAMKAADDILTFKHVVKSIAQMNKLHATFMPKPIYGVAGSGMHTNMSLFRDGKNIFANPEGDKGLSRECYHFIAGLLTHAKGMCVATNPLVNSYKRLVPGYEAPCYLAWSASNRSALIRIPAARGQGTRVELRSPDPTCNPYLALALCLAAGLDGIERELVPPPEITKNIFEMGDMQRVANGINNLPENLNEAIACFMADSLMQETLGEHVVTQYIAGKQAEWDEYRSQVTDWERRKYIVTY